MKTLIEFPKVEDGKPEYPYLAVHRSNTINKTDYCGNDVILIFERGTDVFSQYLSGGFRGSMTSSEESEYIPLPSGTVIKLVQE